MVSICIFLSNMRLIPKMITLSCLSILKSGFKSYWRPLAVNMAPCLAIKRRSIFRNLIRVLQIVEKTKPCSQAVDKAPKINQSN